MARKRQEEKNTEEVHVRMLGGFSIYYGGKPIALGRVEGAKSVRLLQMIFLSFPGGISKNELMDNLYGWNENADVGNRNKNLNNMIYRLKRHLVSCGLPEDEYVEIREGRCYFKSRLRLVLDTRQFEEKVRAAMIWGRVFYEI